MQRNNNNPSQQQPTTSAAGGDEPIQKINIDDYKAEVMRTFNLTTDEEYKKSSVNKHRTLYITVKLDREYEN
jgi:hypothetical protein